MTTLTNILFKRFLWQCNGNKVSAVGSLPRASQVDDVEI